MDETAFRFVTNEKKCIDRSIKEMISKSGSASPLVGFGNASFKQASKGHASSPRRLWAVNRMKQVHGLHVMSINEFNTSRLCNKCHSLDGLSSFAGASNKHFVRQCNNTACSNNKEQGCECVAKHPRSHEL